MRTLCATLLALSTLCVSAAVAMGASPADALAWSVKIEAGDSEGSGTVVGHQGAHSLVLTCDHVLTDDGNHVAPAEVIVKRNGRSYRARLVAQDRQLDLALLDVPAVFPAAPLYDGPLTAGEPEMIIGAPYDEGLAVTTGYVGEMALPFRGDGHRTRQGSAPAHPGNSGGGVFVRRNGWKLAGVEESILAPRGSPPIPDISFFIVMSDVREFLSESHP